MQSLQPLLSAAATLCEEVSSLCSSPLQLFQSLSSEDTPPSLEAYATGMPWDAHLPHRQTIGEGEEENFGKTRGLLSDTMQRPSSSVDPDGEMKLKEVLTEICPLLDRLGRAFTDFSPHLHRYCQPPPVPSEGHSPSSSTLLSTRAGGPPQAMRQGLPFGPLLRQMFLSFPPHLFT
jgi:hypothetical protein